VVAHDVPCDGPGAHRLVGLEILDGEPVAELHTAAGTQRLTRSAVDGSSSVVVTCPCGSYAFGVGRYLAGEWVDPVRLDTRGC
jgi:hypothetical protein